jgi:hypothetical protein
MRLAGVTSLDQLTPAMVNTMEIDHLVTPELGEPARQPQRMSKL